MDRHKLNESGNNHKTISKTTHSQTNYICSWKLFTNSHWIQFGMTFKWCLESEISTSFSDQCFPCTFCVIWKSDTLKIKMKINEKQIVLLLRTVYIYLFVRAIMVIGCTSASVKCSLRNYFEIYRCDTQIHALHYIVIFGMFSGNNAL